VGYAAGYILGGVIAPALGWRAPFLLEAAAMLPFAVFCAVGPALDLRGKQHHTGSCQDLHAFACPCMHMTACKTRRAILGFWLAAFQLVSCSANSACGQQNLPYTCTTWLLQLRPCDRRQLRPCDNHRSHWPCRPWTASTEVLLFVSLHVSWPLTWPLWVQVLSLPHVALSDCCTQDVAGGSR